MLDHRHYHQTRQHDSPFIYGWRLAGNDYPEYAWVLDGVVIQAFYGYVTIFEAQKKTMIIGWDAEGLAWCIDEAQRMEEVEE